MRRGFASHFGKNELDHVDTGSSMNDFASKAREAHASTQCSRGLFLGSLAFPACCHGSRHSGISTRFCSQSRKSLISPTVGSKAFGASIKRILLTEWDPIGISEFPEAQDEYDAYVSEVYWLLSRRTGVREIFDYLWWLETKHMGLCGDRQRTEKIAEKLTTLTSEEVLPGTAPSSTSSPISERY